MRRSLPNWASAAIALVLSASGASAQTWSSCNPLYTTSCPADTALGMTIDVDFTQGSVNSFVASGGTPTYGADGVTFTVAKSGDAPQLSSVFYIMFGRVEFTMKCAPGAGIVSSLVLESDDLDEIDLEWLGADDSEVQTNYFGKGVTGSYNRGQFNPAPNNQAQFVTYTVDWTSERVVWSVGGTVVRTLEYADADGQYPQTPMRVKFGAWSGGDPSNAPGTIQWARGPTDYSKGPFSMVVQSVVISDYSTGSSYTYGDTSGTWQSIKSSGGTVNGNANSAGSLTVTASAAAATSLSPSVPAGGIGGGSTSTETGWPWVPSGTSTGSSSIPSGWKMTSSGKIVPASSTVQNLPTSSSSPAPSSSASSQPTPAAGLNADSAVITTYDQEGFLTTETVPAGWTTMVKSYDQQGFLITPTPQAAAATAAPPVRAAENAQSGAAAVTAGGMAGRWLFLLVISTCLLIATIGL